MRPPAAAGAFYPRDSRTLAETVNQLLSGIEPGEAIPRVVIVPHAGYQYSGAVAAAAYACLKPLDNPRVVLLGVSHYAAFDYAAVYAGDGWRTPLGSVKVDQPGVNHLLAASPLFQVDEAPHEPEHGLEVQLPFLQVLFSRFMIVPVLLSHMTPQQTAAVSAALAGLCDARTIMVVSTDLSHFPTQPDAERVDRQTIEAIVSGDAAHFRAVVSDLPEMPGLLTRACGAAAVEVGMDVAPSPEPPHDPPAVLCQFRADQRRSKPRRGLCSDGVMVKIFAITTRGLEAVSAAEMAACGLRDVVPSYRRVEAVCADPAQASGLRTVDDVFIHLGQWQPVPHIREALTAFTRWSSALDLEPALSTIRQVRLLKTPVYFSVTANFVGQRNYSVPEIKQHVAAGVVLRHAWIYTEDDAQADVNLRIFIEHTEATVGVRLFRAPLHRRPYKLNHLPGSLKPTVAAAMLRIAGGDAVTGSHTGLPQGTHNDAPLQTELTKPFLVDPFCGVGTVLVEAALGGFAAVGGDIDPQVIPLAQENCRATQVTPRVLRWDASHLPLATDCAAGVVTNLPWGRQIPVESGVRRLYRAAFDEMRRIVQPGSPIVLLTTFPDWIDAAPHRQFEISLFGQNPSVLHIVN